MIGELYDGEFENFPREDGVIKDSGLSDEEVDKLLTIAGEMSRVISREKLKEMYPEAIHETVSNPIGLTREMLGIEETGAVVKGRAKGFHIEDEWQKKYQEGYDAGYNACELAYQTKLQDQEEHIHTARVNVLRNCLEDIIKTLDSSPSELIKVLQEGTL